MKKISLFLVVMFLLSGCNKFSDKDLINELDNKVSKSSNYQITATLEISRNEDKYIYDVISTYKKGDYFKVELTNKANNHKQIILKDKKSVYVVTPSLNKNFKFQSDWPYNNSQIYLLQPILSDIKNDSEKTFEKNDNGYIITSKVNYSSEKDFKYQKVYFDLEKELTKIEVLDEKENVKMLFKIINTQYNIKLDDDFFDINEYYKDQENQDENKGENKDQNASIPLDEVVYPMYVPAETYLSGQDIIETDSGERVILTFTGESNFILIQENMAHEGVENYVYGDPYLILDTVGSITDSSISWISEGVEYSVISDTMSIDELITVAQSISVEPISK